MRSLRIPILLFLLCYFGFLAYVAWTVPQLPERIATHFGFGGQPDGWMTRSAYGVFIAVIGLAMPALIVGIFFGMQFLSNGMINIAHREYWLAPERRDETFAYLRRHSLWYASLLVAFFAGLHYLTLQANQQQPAAQLNLPVLFVVLGCFLLGTLWWALSMIRHFQSLHR
jgi:serine/threonine-protein kinase